MGLVTDRTLHVHLGVVIAVNDSDTPVYTDLLAGVGAASIAEIDLARLTILAQGEHIQDFRRLVYRTIPDSHLRRRLLDLLELTSTCD